MNPFRLKMLGALVPAALAGLLGACSGAENLVARAGDHVLTADRLAEMMFSWRRPSVDSGLVARVANWWVDYQLFAGRVVTGDSLLDSATVVDVLWPEARALVLARWRERIFGSQLPLDSARLDSIYQAGDYRLIQHILIQGPEHGPSGARARARRRAEALRARLAGGLSWDVAQRDNQDAAARRVRGSVGVIARGQTEPDFERAAFALGPGEMSAVVGSSYGFHIVRRPGLAEVRGDFRVGVEPIVAERLDSLHIRALAQRWRLTLVSGALERAAAAVRDPLRHRDAHTTIATFTGGRFTLGDLVRWLESVPDWIHTEVERGGDQRLTRFLDVMMGYELLYREALQNGVSLTPSELATLKAELSGRLDRVKAAVGLHPPAPGNSASVDRRRHAAELVDAYLDNLPSDWQRFERVPPLLVDRLKREAGWAVYSRGIRRTLQRVAELQAAADSIPERL